MVACHRRKICVQRNEIEINRIFREVEWVSYLSLRERMKICRVELGGERQAMAMEKTLSEECFIT